MLFSHMRQDPLGIFPKVHSGNISSFVLCDFQGGDVMVLLVLISVKKELFIVGFFGGLVGVGDGHHLRS